MLDSELNQRVRVLHVRTRFVRSYRHINTNFKLQVDDRNIHRVCWSRLFGRFIEHGREKIGCSVEEAARLAGMETREWLAVEGGDVPRPAQLRAMADALEIDHDTMGSLAMFCRGAWEL